MYIEFEYKLHKSTLIACTRWLAWTRNKLDQICDLSEEQGTNEWGTAYYFLYIFLNLLINLLFVI